MSNTSLQSILTSYPEVAKAKVLAPGTGSTFEIFEVEALNRSGSGIDTGIFVRHGDTTGGWQMGELDASDTPDFTDITATIQAGNTVDLFSTTDDDGFLIQSKQRFNMIGITVTQIDTGGATYLYEYFDGTVYQTLALIAEPVYTSAAKIHIVFAAPPDWVVGTTTAVGGDTSLYSIRVTATTAGAQIVQTNDMWIGRMLQFQEALADNASTIVSTGSSQHMALEANEGIMPYFATANAANLVRILYKTR